MAIVEAVSAVSPIVLVAVGILSLVAYVLFHFRIPKIKGMPLVEPCHPLFGSLGEVTGNQHRMPDRHIECTKKYGPTWYQALPGLKPFVHVQSPANIEYVLKTNFDNFVKGDYFRECFGELLGLGIFAADGDTWRHTRKIASHMFSGKVLRDDMSVMFVTHTKELIRRIHKNRKASDKPFDIQDLFYRLTMDAICEIAFGVSMNTINSDVTFARDFDTAQLAITDRLFTVPIVWKTQRLLGLGSEGAFAKSIKRINAFVENLVEERSKENQEILRKHPDLLSRFLSEARDRNEELTKTELRDSVLNFMLAGRDTTACLLSWSIFELGRNPGLQERLVNEFESTCANGSLAAYRAELAKGGNKDDVIWAPTYAEIAEMSFIDVFLKETLRLHPSVPFDAKFAVNDCYLPDGNFFCPAGAWVSYDIYAAMRREEVWGPDAAVFRPERWLEQQTPRTPFEFIAFNAGPRTCLGMHVAMLEAKTALSVLIYHFAVKSHVEEKNGVPIYKTNIVMPVNGGVPVTVVPRV